MEEIKREFIDWKKTGQNLKLLRNDNLNLRRYVCFVLKGAKQECDLNCYECKFDMDPSISQKELSQVFNVSESMVANWESCRSIPSLEDLIFYSKICKLDLMDVIVFA